MPCDNGSCCDRLPTREICVTASETVPSAGTHSTQCHWDVGAETCAAGDCGGVLEARVQSMEAAGLTWGGEVPMQGAYACCKIAWHPDLLDYVDGADENSNTVRTVGGVSAAFGIVKNRYGYMKDVLDHDTLNLDYGKPTRKGMTLADEYTELYVIGEMCAGDFMEMKEFEDWKKILCELKCYNLYGEERPEQNDLHAQYGAPGA